MSDETRSIHLAVANMIFFSSKTTLCSLPLNRWRYTQTNRMSTNNQFEFDSNLFALCASNLPHIYWRLLYHLVRYSWHLRCIFFSFFCLLSLLSSMSMFFRFLSVFLVFLIYLFLFLFFLSISCIVYISSSFTLIPFDRCYYISTGSSISVSLSI